MTKLVLACALLFTLTLSAVDVSGKWTGAVGDGHDAVFQLKMEGAKVTGTMTGAEGGSHPISKGELNGDDLSLTIDSEWQGQAVKLFLKGKVSGDEIKGTLSNEGGEWSTELVLKRSAT